MVRDGDEEVDKSAMNGGLSLSRVVSVFLCPFIIHKSVKVLANG